VYQQAKPWWLTPATLATQEAEIRRISGQIVRETLSRKTLHKNRAGGVAQGEGPEFKPQYHTHTKKSNKRANNPINKWTNELNT
jgi:hypothetical protein